MEEYLFEIIINSRHGNSKAVRSASNSFHLLNKINYKFREKDLSNIVLDNVDISGINFYQTDLSKSKFTNVNISNCNFSEADLTAVIWEKTKLNEMGKLELGCSLNFMTFFDEKCLLVAYEIPYKIKCYNPNNFEEIFDYKFSCFDEKDYKFEDLIKLN